jgi:hypothetical protein
MAEVGDRFLVSRAAVVDTTPDIIQVLSEMRQLHNVEYSNSLSVRIKVMDDDDDDEQYYKQEKLLYFEIQMYGLPFIIESFIGRIEMEWQIEVVKRYHTILPGIFYGFICPTQLFIKPLLKGVQISTGKYSQSMKNQGSTDQLPTTCTTTITTTASDARLFIEDLLNDLDEIETDKNHILYIVNNMGANLNELRNKLNTYLSQ